MLDRVLIEKDGSRSLTKANETRKVDPFPLEGTRVRKDSHDRYQLVPEWLVMPWVGPGSGCATMGSLRGPWLASVAACGEAVPPDLRTMIPTKSDPTRSIKNLFFISAHLPTHRTFRRGSLRISCNKEVHDRIVEDNEVTGFLVTGDLDHALAAEPGLHGVAPSGAQVVVLGVFHGAQPTLRPGANPGENLSRLSAGPRKPGLLGVGLGRVHAVAVAPEVIGRPGVSDSRPRLRFSSLQPGVAPRNLAAGRPAA